MLINGTNIQSIWYDETKEAVFAIDQRKLPFQFEMMEMKSLNDAVFAINEMVVRGAPLIGVTAAWGLHLEIRNIKNTEFQDIKKWAKELKSTRPTAINLALVVDEMVQELSNAQPSDYATVSLSFALKSQNREAQWCEQIGEFGFSLIEEFYQKKQQPVNILTHCNAGWLACVDWGTATAPMYKAHLKGIPLHIWVDETRPRNQGARLTAWELQQAGVLYTVIPDNAGGHLMQHGMVDMVLVGSDRTTLNGDVANKIGTYLKALAAFDNNIPFYAALPSTSIDFTMTDGVKNIPIEHRGADEMLKMEVRHQNITFEALIMPENTPVANYGFDVTPARLITGLITERGICMANEASILNLFPEHLK
jgi:methylthioribose-1-phosphate isomerase